MRGVFNLTLTDDIDVTGITSYSVLVTKHL